MKADVTTDDHVGTEMVRLALAAWPHLPPLVSDYLGPHEWLSQSREKSTDLAELEREAKRLLVEAERAGDAYVALQTRAIATQLEVHLDPDRYGYLELVERLFACKFVAPDPEEVAALAHEVGVLSANAGFAGPGGVARCEAGAATAGEAKWDVALDAYREGRRYALERFPVPFEERLDIGRTEDPITSLHLTWREPDRLVFEVNVGTPRAPATIRYEVAHNIYPGDYLHMAVLTQRTYAPGGHVAACIKLKNAPENVVAEGIEETAPFRLQPHPDEETQLAWRLEWLRRAACVTGAIQRRQAGEPRQAVIEHLRRAGHMTDARAVQEMDRIEHPLWGTYQYTYWLGRHLVEEADRIAGDGVTGARYLEWLYGGLYVPETFLDEARRMAVEAVVS